ncbi:MAG: MarR family winged helix-turn-helix transcriptional regulator [Acutalibacteraceae bacterium]|nr:MarR family winged helix-turn-helix transcriptional regulator [Acutalibacteraceae bacterium]
MIDRFERFSFAISEISRYWHKLTSEEMEKYGLKGTHSVYLLTMFRFPDGITAPRLCELCGKDKSDVSRMMSIMEKKGLVKKEGIHQNLYRGVLKLTEAGKQAAEHVRNRAILAVELAGKDLTDEKREIFYDALESIVLNLRLLSKEGIPQI